jgi:hypothetical protein
MWRANIIKIGDFDESGYPVHWHFGADLTEVEPSNELTVAGYTLAELKEIKEREG